MVTPDADHRVERTGRGRLLRGLAAANTGTARGAGADAAVDGFRRDDAGGLHGWPGSRPGHPYRIARERCAGDRRKGCPLSRGQAPRTAHQPICPLPREAAKLNDRPAAAPITVEYSGWPQSGRLASLPIAWLCIHQERRRRPSTGGMPGKGQEYDKPRCRQRYSDEY